MTRFAVLRHGPTDWNAEKRLQGRTDRPLSPEGRARVAGWRLPAPVVGLAVLSSPLRRARETAALLGLQARIEPALVEMDFGDWEGRTLADLRAEAPVAVAANEARGLDFRPPAGESPRQVQDRLTALLARLAAEGGDVLAVTHKGVIRALLARALDWPMTGRAPVRLDWMSVHLFSLGPDGAPSLERANLPLEPPR